MNEPRRNPLNRLIRPFMEIFGLSRWLAIVTVLLLGAILGAAFYWFFHSAPPTHITITAGPPGSSWETYAARYRELLVSNGVTVTVLPSEGSLQNLERLQDPAFEVDVGFIQGGVSNGLSIVELDSLGSISYEPLVVFYRGNPISLLSEFAGKRLAIGPLGSGTRTLALTLLKLNGIQEGGSTVLEGIDAEPAAEALTNGSIDAVFLMGDSASPQLMRQLLLTPGIQLLSFPQADAYTRRISYLNKLILPAGSVDFGKNIPAHDMFLVSPTVELLARKQLHPALCDLLIEAAQRVHGGANVFKHKGEFPAPVEHDYPISTEAARYYKSGKSFLYRWLPFWLASLMNRILLVFVPVILLLVPAMKLLPSFLSLRVKLRLYRWYRALLLVEHDLQQLRPAQEPGQLLERLDHIDREVSRMNVPASYADQFYMLRGSIGFVRQQVRESAAAKTQ
jgi:TRAP-type uncharacterized transport system substrate-binding protein